MTHSAPEGEHHYSVLEELLHSISHGIRRPHLKRLFQRLFR